jgi:hypothetical protein
VVLFPVLPPELLGGFVEGLPLLESGVVLGGFEPGLVVLSGVVEAPELLWLELPVAELSLVPEVPGVAEPLFGEELVSGVELVFGVVPLLGVLMVPLCPDWSCELWPVEGEVVLDPLWVVVVPSLDVLVDWLLVPVLLCATAKAPAATKTNKIPGIRVIRISCIRNLLLEARGTCCCISTPPPRSSRTTPWPGLNTRARVRGRWS